MLNVSLMGLGIMGSGMAGNILRAGFPLTVYNRSKDKASTLLDAGARWADSPAAAAAGADVLISVLSNEQASRSLWLGERGALDALPAGAVAVECSTLPVAWVKELEALARDRGIAFMDVPLAGSKQPARAGTLTVFAGAAPETLARVRPVLEAFSSQILHFGPPGSATTYKLINNMMIGVHVAALGEAIALAEKAGLDREVVAAATMNGSVSSPIVKGKLQQVLAREHSDTNFALRWMHKDLTYALAAANEAGVPMPTVAAVRELYALAMQRGLSDLDFAAVSELVRD